MQSTPFSFLDPAGPSAGPSAAVSMSAAATGPQSYRTYCARTWSPDVRDGYRSPRPPVDDRRRGGRRRSSATPRRFVHEARAEGDKVPSQKRTIKKTVFLLTFYNTHADAPFA